LAAGIIALVVIIYIGKIIEMSKGHPDPGITTEAALLLMFAVGAYLVVGDRAAAIAIGGGAAVLLHFKGELHGIVARLGANDLKAIMQFALISLSSCRCCLTGLMALSPCSTRATSGGWSC
jgi:uncharacterized membrane protein (DUF4010 family)